MTSLANVERLRREDAQARALAISSFDRPLFLEAGAGTGKTTTLVARIVTWCVGPGWIDAERRLASSEHSDGLDRDARVAELAVRGVLAVTFTEAAAAEMETKIRFALAGLESGIWPRGIAEHAAATRELGLSLEIARRRAARVAAALDRRVVLTIHAWCREILAEHPLEAGIAPQFRVDADGVETERAVRETIESAIVAALGAEPDPDWLVLARAHVGPAELEEALLRLSADGIESDDLAIDPFTPDRIARLCGELGQSAARFAAVASPLLESVKSVPVSRAALDSIERTCDAIPAHAVRDIDELQAVGERVRELWSERLRKRLDDWSRGAFGTREGKAIGEHASEVRARALALSEHVDRFERLDPRLASSARRVLASLSAEIRRKLRSRGVVTFADLLRDARNLLRRHAEIAAEIRRRTRQLLVDEFQDTDPLQCDLVRVLALEERNAAARESSPGLFLVGDPKQSIYAWRSADLSAYEAFQRDVVAAGGRSLRLSVNYRSTPAILREVERAIAPVMNPEPGVQPAFQPLVADAKQGGEPVEHWVSWELDPESPKRLFDTPAERACRIEARWIAADLRRRHEAGAEWKSMALLLRTGSNLDIYLQALREREVEFDVAGDKSYYRRREIIDAASLVRTVIDPHDHLALITALRSCVIGVPDAALIPLWTHGFPAAMSALAGDSPDELAPARASVRRAVAAMPVDVPGLDRIDGWEEILLDAVEKLAHLRRAFARQPLDVFVERLRTLFLCEAMEASRPFAAWRIANLERFFRKLSRELADDGGDPHAVLRALRRALSDERDAEEARPQSELSDAVQVMTIHKSKGLDFEHVYVAAMHREAKRDGALRFDVVRRGEHVEFVLFGATSPDYADVRAGRARQAFAELVRTLYVAMTRAKDRLVLAGAWPEVIDPKPAGSCRTYVELLSQSARADLPAHLSACADRPGARLELDERVYVLPPAPEATPSAEPERAWEDLDVAAIDSDAAALRSARTAAAERMARPFSRAISFDEEDRSMRSAEDEPARPSSRGSLDSVSARVAAVGSSSRAPALAGSAVHLALEELDWQADLELELRRSRASLTTWIRRANRVPSAEAEAAVAIAESIFDRFARGELFARLAASREHIVARELPVVSLPDEDDRAVGYRIGLIDLVYRDRGSGELVVVDYKTDAVNTREEAEARAVHYAAQASAYPRAVRQALGLDRDPRFELWFLAVDRAITVDPALRRDPAGSPKP
jgi:ATP-dependent helicase/nuclease subunit A